MAPVPSQGVGGPARKRGQRNLVCTREPSGSRASTQGDVASTRRPRGATMRSITWRTASSPSNRRSNTLSIRGHHSISGYLTSSDSRAEGASRLRFRCSEDLRVGRPARERIFQIWKISEPRTSARFLGSRLPFPGRAPLFPLVRAVSASRARSSACRVAGADRRITRRGTEAAPGSAACRRAARACARPPPASRQALRSLARGARSARPCACDPEPLGGFLRGHADERSLRRREPPPATVERSLLQVPVEARRRGIGAALIRG
jgi:hypothetical protein